MRCAECWRFTGGRQREPHIRINYWSDVLPERVFGNVRQEDGGIYRYGSNFIHFRRNGRQGDRMNKFRIRSCVGRMKSALVKTFGVKRA